jgi:hypothetical protein
MPLVRKSPLPVGWYWVDYPAAKGRAFEAWARSTDGVHIRATEFDSDSTLTWVLFEVTKPAPWSAKEIGFWPDAGRPGMTVDDVVQRPEPTPDLPERIEQAANKFADAFKLVAVVGGVVGVVWLVHAVTKKAT